MSKKAALERPLEFRWVTATTLQTRFWGWKVSETEKTLGQREEGQEVVL